MLRCADGAGFASACRQSPQSFSEIELTEDLKRFAVPTLVLRSDDDQIVPYRDSALLSSTIVKNVTMKIYEGTSATAGVVVVQVGNYHANLKRYAAPRAASLPMRVVSVRPGNPFRTARAPSSR